MADRADKDANRAVYDELRGDERRRFGVEPSKVYTSELIVPWIASRLGPGDRLLDVAGGAGAFASLIARAADVEVVGLDISESMVAQRAEDPRLAENVVGDMEALPFEPESFDAVMFVACLHHVPDPLPALREALRVLRPGGRMFAAEPSSLRAWRTGSVPIPGSPHEFRLSARWLRRRTTAAGFEVEETRAERIAIRALRLVSPSPSLRLFRIGGAADRLLRVLPGAGSLAELTLLRARKPGV
jgi:SAM-dependent methyltransferase